MRGRNPEEVLLGERSAAARPGPGASLRRPGRSGGADPAYRLILGSALALTAVGIVPSASPG